MGRPSKTGKGGSLEMGNTFNTCRFCDNRLERIFVDLGMSPLANSYLRAEGLQQMEPHYPLCVYVCEACSLIQLPVYQTPEEIFGDYAYFSSYSDSWLKHAKNYADLIVERFRFDSNSQVIEIASNDGYLLQYFKVKGIPVLGVEPAENVAKAAEEEKCIPTLCKFFNTETATLLKDENKAADLIIGNN